MNLPNILSCSRVLLLFPIIFFYEYGFYLISTSFFILASFSDFLDGYIARKKNQTSELGALLDLFADKIFVSVLLIWMTFTLDSLLILASTILIVSRELSVSYLRLYFVLNSKQFNNVKADFFGKLKTTIQMIGLGSILISPYFSSYIIYAALITLFASSIFSWISLINYFKNWHEDEN